MIKHECFSERSITITVNYCTSTANVQLPFTLSSECESLEQSVILLRQHSGVTLRPIKSRREKFNSVSQTESALTVECINNMKLVLI